MFNDYESWMGVKHTVPTYTGQLTVKDLKTVRKAVWGARTKWMDIGLELDLDVTDLTAIDATHRGDVGRCFIEMLTLWLKQVDPPPTWSTMVAALQEPIIGYGDIAEQVENKYVHQSSEASDITDSGPSTESQGEIVVARRFLQITTVSQASIHSVLGNLPHPYFMTASV